MGGLGYCLLLFIWETGRADGVILLLLLNNKYGKGVEEIMMTVGSKKGCDGRRRWEWGTRAESGEWVTLLDGKQEKGYDIDEE